jgi:hypothetical protein
VFCPRSALGGLRPPQEDVLAELLKRTGTGLLSRGKKFGGLDIKRVYFGWVSLCIVYRQTLKALHRAFLAVTGQ